MDWRKDIHIEEIKKPRTANENIFQKTIPYASSRYNNSDLQALCVASLGILGAVILSIPHLWPAVGEHSFLHIDLALWYDGFTLLALGSSITLVGVSVNRVLAKSKLIRHLFSPFKHSITTKLALIGFVISQLFFLSFNIVAPHTLKTMDTWRSLEAQHLDSRDPVKRNLYNLEKFRTDNDLNQVQKNMQERLDTLQKEVDNSSKIIEQYNQRIEPTIILPDTISHTAPHLLNQNSINSPSIPSNIHTDSLNDEQKAQVQGLIQSAREFNQSLQK